MKTIILLLGLLIFSPTVAQIGNIKISISALKSAKGSVLIYLYRSDDGFPTEPEKAWKTATVNITATNTEYIFTNIPFASYAISLAHDENRNGKLDTNFIGIPKEGIGTSNNAKGNFGPPSYGDAKFEHQSNLTSTVIKINY